MAGRKHPPSNQQPQYSGSGVSGGGWGGGVRPRPSSARNPTSHASLVYRKAAAASTIHGGGGGGGGAGGRTQPESMQVSLLLVCFPGKHVPVCRHQVIKPCAHVPTQTRCVGRIAALSKGSVVVRFHQHTSGPVFDFRRMRTLPHAQSMRLLPVTPQTASAHGYRENHAPSSVDVSALTERSSQASFFPLLSAEDDAHPDQQNTRLHHRHSNDNNHNVGGVPVAAASPAATPATEAAAKKAPTSSRPFASKPLQQRDKGVGKPFRAYPAAPSPAADDAGQDRPAAAGSTSLSGNASCGSPTAGADVGGGGGGGGGTSNGGEGHKPFTPRSLALASDASARLVVSRTPPQQTTPARFNPARSSTSSGSSSARGAGGAAADGSSSQISGGGGHGDGKNQASGQHQYQQPLSRQWQLSRSANASTASSPRTSRASSPPGWAHDRDATLGYGVVAPPHGGRADIGEGGGRRYSQGVMRPTKSNSGSVGGGSNSTKGAASSSADDANITAPPPQARGHSRDAGRKGIEATGEGVLLPGPEGGVEVREFDGGVLVVSRNEEEKKKSPERLNLHRRRLKSCPVVQVSGSQLVRPETTVLSAPGASGSTSKPRCSVEFEV